MEVERVSVSPRLNYNLTILKTRTPVVLETLWLIGEHFGPTLRFPRSHALFMCKIRNMPTFTKTPN